MPRDRKRELRATCHFCNQHRKVKRVRYPNLTFDVMVCAKCRKRAEDTK